MGHRNNILALISGTLILSSAALSGCGKQTLDAAGQMRIVGSSSAQQYGAAVGEALLLEQASLKPPIIESTGSGQGIELFCSAIGGTTPDIAFSSRRMKKEEYDKCVANGVKDTVEFQVGMDGVIMAQVKGGQSWQLTSIDAYRAFAAFPFGLHNRAEKWNQVNPALPALPIQLYGPGTSSGTRSGFADLIMSPPCKADPRVAAINDKDSIKKICTQIRDDGRYFLTDENDALMLYKLKTNRDAIGVVPLAFVTDHADIVQALPIDGIMPSGATIADETYPGTRRIYVYIKRAHLDKVPGLKAYATKLQAESGPDGMLSQNRIIPAPAAVRAESAAIVKVWRAVDAAALK